MTKGEQLAIACFVAGMHAHETPMSSAAALIDLIEYIRELERKPSTASAAE